MADLLQANAYSQDYQVQMLMGIETLKASGNEDQAFTKCSNIFINEANIAQKQGRYMAIVDSILTSLSAAAPLVLLVVGAHFVLNGSLSLGAMLAFQALALGFLVPMGNLFGIGFKLQQLGSYLERISDVFETPREQDLSQSKIPHRLKGGIRVEHIDFRYSPLNDNTIDGISCEILPGQFAAIVGPSGSGKSTFARLLIGLYLPDAGHIFYDDVNLKELNLKMLRQQIGIVTQDPKLFGGTVRENIALGQEEASLARVSKAAMIAQIHQDILSTPLGYDTIVSERGAPFSGGQCQRLALARALYDDPSILLLDEATSALDTLTEEKIYTSLQDLSASRIVIAHRLSTIVHADVIFVLDQGKLIEKGNHQSLLEEGGLYAKLTRSDQKLRNDGLHLRVAP